MTTADIAPRGHAWRLAELITPADGSAQYYKTMPEYGWFQYRTAARRTADAIRGERIVHPILIEFFPVIED